MNTVNVRLSLDTRSKNENGLFPVVIIARNVNVIRVSTPYRCAPDDWVDGQLSKKVMNAAKKNLHLKDILQKAERLFIDLSEENKRITDKQARERLKEIINGAKSERKFFVDYLDEFVMTKANSGTRTVYNTTRNKLLKFDPKCTFETMDRAWLAKFERWMQESGMKVNALAIHLRNVRAVFNYCLDEEYTTLYPFRRFSIKKEETRKRSLTVEQLRTLRDYPCEDYQIKYRDMFMLMFYLIGINAADLFLAKKSDLVNGRLEYKRAKTGKLYSVLVHPEAMEIINRYAGTGEYLLNVMDDYGDYKDFLHRMGKALKDIGPMQRVGRGGKKVREPLFPEISSYWSRHTWATLAAQLDVPKEVISAGLGHEIGSPVTSIYINFDIKKVDEANRTVIDYVNGTEKATK